MNLWCRSLLLWGTVTLTTTMVVGFVLPQTSSRPYHSVASAVPVSFSPTALSAQNFATDLYLAQLSSQSANGVWEYADSAYYHNDPQTYVNDMAVVAADLQETWSSSVGNENQEMWDRIAAAADYVPPTAATATSSAWMAAESSAPENLATTAAVPTTVSSSDAANSVVTSSPTLVTPELSSSLIPPVTETVATVTATSSSSSPPPAIASSTGAVETNVDSLKSQLADLANSFSFDDPPSLSSSPLQGLSQVWGDAVSQLSQSSTDAFSQLSQSSSQALVQGQQGFVKALTNIPPPTPPSTDKLWEGVQNIAQGTAATAAWVAAAPGQLVQGTQDTVKFATTARISDVAAAAAAVVVKVAQMILSVLNVLIEAVTGLTVADVVHTAQTAVQNMADSAVSAVVETIHQIGSMTLQEAAVSLVSLVVTVTTILFRILSGILELVTGKNAGEWALVTQQAVAQAAQDAVHAAGQTATDLSHKSLTELVGLLGQWEQDMTTTVVATARQAMESSDFAASSMALSSLLNQ